MNIVTEFNSINVDVTLNEGVNLLSGDSGTGKTLLMQVVEFYCLENDIRYAFINYRQARYTFEQIISDCNGAEMILIDNADLFITEELMKELKKIGKYILISLKDATKIDASNITEFLVHYENRKLRLEEI